MSDLPKNDLVSDLRLANQPHTVLVVDDVEMNRDMLSRRLKRQGYRVAIAENGRQAIEMLARQPIDLILLDIMMPEMDGYQVLAHLKQDAQLKYIPVIMITALNEIDSVVRCIEMGAEDYLPKPFNPVLLQARVNASLEKKRSYDMKRNTGGASRITISCLSNLSGSRSRRSPRRSFQRFSPCPSWPNRATPRRASILNASASTASGWRRKWRAREATAIR